MARGWESKAVEAQMEQAALRPEEAAPVALSPAARARQERRESLQLVRSNLVQQLGRARSEMQRRSIEQTLAALETELAELA